MGIIDTLLGRREPAVEYRTIDGGHPAPFPDMTDEQLYNYEVTFNVPNRTFSEPPRTVRPPEGWRPGDDPGMRREPRTEMAREAARESARERAQESTEEPSPHASRHTRPAPPPMPQSELPPLDLSRPVRLITSGQPVEILTTRARHPVYKVHGYIGDDEVVTVFTLDGRLSENGPRYLENVPAHQSLFLNVYLNPNGPNDERYLFTQHASRKQADAAARPGRLACVPLQLDL